MPGVARKGDAVLSPTGNGGPLVLCSSPLDIKVEEVNSASVYADNILIVVEGNKVAPHPKKKCELDESVLDSYSPNVFIGGKKLGRKGDAYDTNTPDEKNVITEGSSDVFANG